MYRVIYSLRLKFDVTPRGGSSDLLVNLTPEGNSELPNGPRPRHKQRIVDLRVGDEFLWRDQWKRVEKITMEVERLITDEEAATWDGEGGWLVKAPEGYVSPLTGGSVRRDG